MSFSWSKAAEKRQVNDDVIRHLRDELLSVKSGKRRAFNAAALADLDHVIAMPFREGLFEFARRLKARSQEHGVETNNGAIDPLLALLLESWGRPYPITELRAQLQHFLKHCRRPAGQGVIDAAAEQTRHPSTWPQVYEEPAANHLLALCRALAAAAQDGVFYLSCRSAAQICGYMNAVTAGTRINMLIADGWLEVVASHTKVRARRFRLGAKNPTLQSAKNRTLQSVQSVQSVQSNRVTE